MAIPGAARVVMADTGHLLYLEKPEVFPSLVTEFLKSHGFGTTARIHPTNIYPGLVFC
jgi:hypothetical protein